MPGSEAFEIVGRVDVVAANLPADMAAEDRERARAARECNVLVVLERHQAALERVINQRASDAMPNGVSTTTELAFDDELPGFSVRVTPNCSDGEGDGLDRHAISSDLAEIVSEAVSSEIAERATQIGMWRADVSAAPKTNAAAAANVAIATQSVGAYAAVLWLIGLAIVGVGFWAYLRG